MRPTYAEVEQTLLGRWPETRLDPTLDRISALCRLLGDPQNAYPVVHLTGTNGKTSTARMIDNLLRALELRTGRFTSPHLQSMTERICLDGEPLTEDEFVDAFSDVAAYAQIVDDSSERTAAVVLRDDGRDGLRRIRRRPGRRGGRGGRHGRHAGTPRTSPTARSRSSRRSPSTMRPTWATAPR